MVVDVALRPHGIMLKGEPGQTAECSRGAAVAMGGRRQVSLSSSPATRGVWHELTSCRGTILSSVSVTRQPLSARTVASSQPLAERQRGSE